MNLKGLMHREVDERLTEKDVAAMVGVSVRTNMRILADISPRRSCDVAKVCHLFSYGCGFFTGRRGATPRNLPQSEGHVCCAQMRKVPLLLNWAQISEMVEGKKPSPVADRVAMIETNVQGLRTFAVKVKDDSMYPMFGEGEVIFVNPDLTSEPGHFVLAGARTSFQSAMVREFNMIGEQYVLHPLNRRYNDLPLMNDQCLWGKVVRLRNNL
ncbi:MAG: hypothetical protein OJF52_001478 [Nitrospira sp.]|nr:MAG: hypothetical protein OJF52_001478 [Nitrospira sp.]